MTWKMTWKMRAPHSVFTVSSPEELVRNLKTVFLYFIFSYIDFINDCPLAYLHVNCLALKFI